ncbi:endonuclease VII domain-containing protein [Streptomyces sp. NPDC057580]|uniref:endonuclease VII domain-containing protein n=1 Tax=Streptomyces sp. NPDC057580 TaxID=3346173 RepID=UPI0036742303
MTAELATPERPLTSLLGGASERIEPDRACIRCRETKPATAFHRNGANLRRRMCAACRSATAPPKNTTPELKLRDKLQREYGITLEQYHLLLAAQNGVCAICEIAPTEKKRLHVDHCHKTGRVRALLCVVCNTQLGSYERMRGRADAYLAQYGAGNSVLGYAPTPK